MAINFLPNDPLAAAMQLRQQDPRPDRSDGSAKLSWSGVTAEGQYSPGSAEFLFWQAREAVLAAVEAWEALNGPLAKWAAQVPDQLAVLQDAGQDLNAYYDGKSVSFFHSTAGTKTTFSGASTDVVSHETGHALLDSIRPELWDSPLPEISGFHEAFGDCMALLTALFDRDTRLSLLAASPDLGSANFVETLMEDLADAALRALGPDHPAAAPRHALNAFMWQLPTTLPSWGPPATLIAEPHSLGRVFCGCFYDTIRNLFSAAAAPGDQSPNEAALLTAAQTAGRLLIRGAAKAPEGERFFQAVGRAMELEDQADNGGANRQAIENAFSAHGIALGSDAMVSPRASLQGPAPAVSPARAGALASSTRQDLLQRIGAPADTRLSLTPVSLGGQLVTKAIHRREVSLDSLNDALKGVVAIAPEPVLVGGVARRAVLLSALPESNATRDEVYKFVETLLRHGQLDLGQTTRRGVAAAIAAPPAEPQTRTLPTHAVRSRGGKKTLVRLRFACRPGA